MSWRTETPVRRPRRGNSSSICFRRAAVRGSFSSELSVKCHARHNWPARIRGVAARLLRLPLAPLDRLNNRGRADVVQVAGRCGNRGVPELFRDNPYVHALGSWLAHRKSEEAASIWPQAGDTIGRVYEMLGSATPLKRWLVACLWKKLQENAAHCGRGELDLEP